MLRLELTRRQSPIGRRPGARGPGNRTRRMRMVVDVPEPVADPDTLRARLTHGLAARVDPDEIAIAVVVRGRAGQGVTSDAASRRAIERHAVDAAFRRLRAETWTVEDVGDTESYDLRCTRDGEELHVEVKGTTSDGGSVLITSNELRHARTYPRVALFVVAAIEVERDANGHPRARGGFERLIDPWLPADQDLKALAFRCDVR